MPAGVMMQTRTFCFQDSVPPAVDLSDMLWRWQHGNDDINSCTWLLYRVSISLLQPKLFAAMVTPDLSRQCKVMMVLNGGQNGETNNLAEISPVYDATRSFKCHVRVAVYLLWPPFVLDWMLLLLHLYRQLP